MKYKINRNQPPLTNEELANARSFHQVIKGYRSMKVPFYKNGKFMTRGSALIVAAAVALIVLFDDKGETTRPFISPPIAKALIPTDSFTVSADSASEIHYKSGSTIHIPAAAFRDAKGNLIKGKVTVKYREFHDQKDIFLSGIPMTYDSAGKTYVFESAGMMEIGASQNEQALTANAEKPIQVDMISNTKEDRYNTYYLDTISRKWVNIHQSNLNMAKLNADSVVSSKPSLADQDDPMISQSKQEVNKATVALKAVEKQKPMPVIAADKEKTTFHIDIDENDFPEIAMYKGVIFQVKNESDFDMKSAKQQWHDVKLKKLSGMDYEVTFINGSKEFKVAATPVVADKNLIAARKVYDRKFADYQAKLSEKQAAEEKALKEYEARVAEENKIRDQQRRIYEASLSQSQLVYRTFTINKFGTYNCDCPALWPSEADVVAKLTDEDGNKLHVYSLNLVEKNVNSIFPYAVGNSECLHFRFTASSDNMIWAMTSDNKLAIVDVNSFKAQQSKKGPVEFRFKVIDKNFKSSDEVKKYLEI